MINQAQEAIGVLNITILNLKARRRHILTCMESVKSNELGGQLQKINRQIAEISEQILRLRKYSYDLGKAGKRDAVA